MGVAMPTGTFVFGICAWIARTKATEFIGSRPASHVLINIQAPAQQNLKIHRVIIRWQAEFLQVRIGNDGRGRLIFVSADVHRAASNTGVAVKVSRHCDIDIIARVDAGGSRLEVGNRYQLDSQTAER